MHGFVRETHPSAPRPSWFALTVRAAASRFPACFAFSVLLVNEITKCILAAATVSETRKSPKCCSALLDCGLVSVNEHYKIVTSSIRMPSRHPGNEKGTFRKLAGGERTLSSLKSVLAEKIPAKQAELAKLKKEHGHKSVGEVKAQKVAC